MQLFAKTLVLDALLLAGQALAHDLAKRQAIPDPSGIQYAPVPERALEPPFGPEGYLVENFGGGVYMVADGIYQSMFLAGDKGVIVVDCPPSMGVRLQYAIGNVTDAPVKAVVYSHSHADHVAGASLFAGPDVEFIGHEETAALLSKAADPNRPVPKTTFREHKTVKVGNQTLELSYKGVNHNPGNIFIYEPTRKVLMLVDVIFPKWVPFYQFAVAESIFGFIDAHDQVLEYDFDHFLGGHITRPGTREDVQLQKEYIRDIYFTCRDITYGGAFDTTPYVQAVLAQNPGNGWAAARRGYSSRAEACANATTPRWIDRLGGADVFGYDNAFQMVFNLVVDFGQTGAVPAAFQNQSSGYD